MHDRSQPMTAAQSLIDIHGCIRPVWLRPLTALICRPIERLLAIDKLSATYADLLEDQSDNTPFGQILNLLDITYRLTSDDLAKIPSHGPLAPVDHIQANLVQRLRQLAGFPDQTLQHLGLQIVSRHHTTP